jgi:hypothetical protein
MMEKTNGLPIWRSRPADQRGVTMVIVIFVAAALLVVSTTAAFVAVREFRAGSDDRKATEALAYAEAGVDRMIQYIRNSGAITFGALRQAGCTAGPITIPQTSIGNGTFSVTAWVYNPQGPTPVDKLATLHPRNNGASTFACSNVAVNPRETAYLAIESIGEHPAAKRIVQQVVQVQPRGLPIGVSADSIEASGTPQTIGISMVSEQKIIGREKIRFTGTDPYYTVGDFWPDGPFPAGISASTPVPSAAHAVQGIYMKSNGTDWEFQGGPQNCTANGAGGQSLWDSDGVGSHSPQHSPIAGGCAGQVGYPPHSYFSAADLARVAPSSLDEADHRALKQAANAYGIYCSIPTSGSATCLKQGVTYPYQSVWQDGDVASLFTGGTLNFVTYFEFTGGSALSNRIKWKADVWGCTDDPAVNRSAVIVVRNGGMDLENGASVNGALLLDGEFKYSGNVIFNGTIVAQKFNISGNSTFSLDPCWVRNMPGPFLAVTPQHWSELDR